MSIHMWHHLNKRRHPNSCLLQLRYTSSAQYHGLLARHPQPPCPAFPWLPRQPALSAPRGNLHLVESQPSG
jgi:hypothetical protein